MPNQSLSKKRKNYEMLMKALMFLSKGSRVGGHGMLDPGYTTRVCSAEIWMVRWVPCDPRSSHPSLWKGLKFWLGLLGAPVTRVSPGRTLGTALFSQPS